jgi:hypothetical protein
MVVTRHSTMITGRPSSPVRDVTIDPTADNSATIYRKMLTRLLSGQPMVLSIIIC